jgi:V/A-type H+-transporting ATPase subunit C
MTRLGTYAYLNARLRARLGKLLSPQEYQALSSAPNLLAIYERLRHTDYSGAISEARSAADLPQVESALVEHLVECHRQVAAHTSGHVRAFLTELLRKFETDNLKAVLRVWNSKVAEERQFIHRDLICFEIPIDAILEAETIEEVIVLLEDTPYRKPLSRERENFKQSGSLFRIEVALDRELYESTWSTIEKLPASDKKIAARLLGIEIDILNINSILRFYKYYKLSLPEIAALIIPHGLEIDSAVLTHVYPGTDPATFATSVLAGPYRGISEAVAGEEETRALQMVEDLLRELFFQQVRKALGGFPFTIGVAIAYLRLKKMEVSNIITILNAKALDRPWEEIENTLIRV